jgi:hypothetical protein
MWEGLFPPRNDIEFSGERKRVRCNEGLDAACDDGADERVFPESPTCRISMCPKGPSLRSTPGGEAQTV